MSKVTLKSLAQDLGLSISTVSKALSDSYEISIETKDRVRKYADEKQFKPNPFAKSLRTGRTNTIGVIISSINNAFMAQLVDGIQQATISTQYNIIIMQSQENIEKERECLELLYNKGVDGIILSPVSEEANIDLIRKLHTGDCPVVLFDRINSTLETHKIGINNISGAYRGTKLLIDLGFKHILHIAAKDVGVSRDRFKGFMQAMDEAQIPFSEELYVEINIGDQQEMKTELSRLFELIKQKKLQVDAIFGGTDSTSITALGVLAELGIQVPQEISLIGFANTDLAFALNPALTAIVQPAEEIGSHSFTKLLELINKKSYMEVEYKTIELETHIVQRKSTIQKEEADYI